MMLSDSRVTRVIAIMRSSSFLRRFIPALLTLAISLASLHGQNTGFQDRDEAVKTLDRIARPVLESLAAGKLKARIPLGPGEEARRNFTCLEAFGRTMAGIAPWIALGPDETPEGQLGARYIDWQPLLVSYGTIAPWVACGRSTLDIACEGVDPEATLGG
jgi:hypothetical protein